MASSGFTARPPATNRTTTSDPDPQSGPDLIFISEIRNTPVDDFSEITSQIRGDATGTFGGGRLTRCHGMGHEGGRGTCARTSSSHDDGDWTRRTDGRAPSMCYSATRAGPDPDQLFTRRWAQVYHHHTPTPECYCASWEPASQVTDWRGKKKLHDVKKKKLRDVKLLAVVIF